MKGLLFFLLLIASSLTAFGQFQDVVWQRNYGSGYLQFSPTQPYFASCGVGGAYIIEILSGNVIRNIKSLKEESASCLAFTRDGKYLATGTSSGVIELWNTETWDNIIVDTLKNAGLNRAPIMDLDFSPDGSVLAAACLDSGMIFYDTKTWQRKLKWYDYKNYPKPYPMVESVSFSYDGKMIAIGTGSGNSGDVITLYDVDDGFTAKHFPGTAAKYSPTRNELVVLQGKNNLGIDYYRYDDSTKPAHYSMYDGYGAEKIGYTSDGNFLICYGSIQAVIIRRTRDFSLAHNYHKENYTTPVAAIDPTNKYLCTQIDSLYMFYLDDYLNVEDGNQSGALIIYPNPATNTIQINYTVDIPGTISIHINDIRGKTCMTLKNEFTDAGSYSLTVQADDLSSGSYFLVFEQNKKVITRQFQVIK